VTQYYHIAPESHRKIHIPICNPKGRIDPALKNICSKKKKDMKSDNIYKDGMHKAGMQTNHN